MVKVTVKPNGLVEGQKAWDGSPADNVITYRTVSLVEACSTQYDSPAFLLPYRLERLDGEPVDRCPWLDTDALPHLAEYGLRLVFDVAVGDVDHPEVHAGKLKKVPQKWRDEMWGKAEQACPNSLIYDTPRGMRIVAALPRPMDAGDYVKWCRKFRQHLRACGLAKVDEIKSWHQFYWMPYSVVGGKRRNPARVELREPAAMVLPTRKADDAPRVFAGIEEVQTFEAYTPPDVVGAGERHRELTRYAGFVRNQHKDEQTILALLLLFDRQRCQPPMQDEGMAELEGIARWAANRKDNEDPAGNAQAGNGGGGADNGGGGADNAGGGDNPPEPAPLMDRLERGDHVELANRVIATFEEGTESLVYALGKLWRYNPKKGLWEYLPPDVVHREIHKYAGVQVRTERPQGGWMLRPLKINASTVEGTYDIICQAKANPDFFLEAPAGLTLADRWVEVGSNQLIFHEHAAWQRSRMGYDFAWSNNRPERFLKLLDDVWDGDESREDKKQVLLEFIGACLCGIATKMQQAIILKGSGSNGKSTVLDAVVGIFPKGTVSNVTPQNFGQQYYRAMLTGSLINVVGELPEKRLDQTAAGALKALVSGDQIDARVIRESPFFFRPKAGHIASCNNLPEVEDDSHGFFRRWLILDFNRLFTATSESRRLVPEMLDAELAEIVCWCLRNAASVIQRGHYIEPKQSIDEVAAWRLGQDEISLFIAEMCERTESTRGNGSDGPSLYDAYAVWAPANGYNTRNKQRFLQAIDKRAKKFFDNSVRNYRYPLALKG